jgi:hypothetical protein
MAGAGSGGLGDLHPGVAQGDPDLVDDQLDTGPLLALARLKGPLP